MGWKDFERGVCERLGVRHYTVSEQSGRVGLPDGEGENFIVEIKRHKRIAIPHWIRQAKFSAKLLKKKPCIIFLHDGQAWALFRLRDIKDRIPW